MRDEEEVYSFSHRLAYPQDLAGDRQVSPKKKAKRALSMMMRGQAEEELEEEEEEELDDDSQDAAICT